MAEPSNTTEWFEKLCEKHGLEYPAISQARITADRKKEEIEQALRDANIDLSSGELSMVVFGSLARRELTSGSDVDWTLLVDGRARPEHFSLVVEIQNTLKKIGLSDPGKTATFGTLSSSHDLVHYIGGLDDTNRNMTRRLCLLLESCAIADEELVRDRVVQSVLSRYIDSGRGIPRVGGPRFRTPGFLLNDVVRYWRTIAVDYAAKKWLQSDESWALRNVKLRVPRKMTFVKGLLLAFDCELFPESSPWGEQYEDKSAVVQQMVSGCRSLVELTPMDILCRALYLLESPVDLVRPILSSYDEYLTLVDDTRKRNHLKELRFADATSDVVFNDVRDGLGRIFGVSLEELFFQTPQLSELTKKYGLF